MPKYTPTLTEFKRLAKKGNLVPVYRVLPEIHIYYVVRAGLGLLIFSSAVLGFYNIVRTLFGKTGASS